MLISGVMIVYNIHNKENVSLKHASLCFSHVYHTFVVGYYMIFVVVLCCTSVIFCTCMRVFRLKAGFNCKSFVVTDLPGDQQHRSNDLEVVVAGEGDEQMQE